MEEIKNSKKNQFLSKFKEFAMRNLCEIITFTLYLIFLFILRYIVFLQPPYVLYSEGEYDWEFYYRMSNDITLIFQREIIVPFCYRVLYPFIVYLLPFHPLFSFNVITFMAFLLMGIILYYTLRLHFSKTYSVIGLVFLSAFMCASSEFFMMPFHFGYAIDALANLFFICCFYAILTSKKKLYMILLFFGVLTKENVLLTVIVFFFVNYYEDHQTLKFKQFLTSIYKNVKYVLPSIFILIVLRLIIVPLPVLEHPTWSALWGGDYLSLGFFIYHIQQHLLYPLSTIIALTYGAWSITFIFLFFNSKKNWMNWLKIYGVFVCVVYLQLLFGAHIVRTIIIAYYPMIVFSVFGFKHIIDHYYKKQLKQVDFDFFKPIEFSS